MFIVMKKKKRCSTTVPFKTVTVNYHDCHQKVRHRAAHGQAFDGHSGQIHFETHVSLNDERFERTSHVDQRNVIYRAQSYIIHSYRSHSMECLLL